MRYSQSLSAPYLAVVILTLPAAFCRCNSDLAAAARLTDQQLSACNDLDSGDVTPGGSRPGPAPDIQVCLLRGLDDVFSVGLDTLQAEMSAVGIDATVISGPDWETIGPQMEAKRAKEINPPDIVLIGHSYGSDDAVRLATYLQGQNTPVRFLLLLDATDPPPIPSNVDRCLHLYNLWLPGDVAPDLFSGNPVVPAAGNAHTAITNEVVNPGNPDPALACVNHFNIDASTGIHKRIFDEIYALQSPASQPSAGP